MLQFVSQAAESSTAWRHLPRKKKEIINIFIFALFVNSPALFYMFSSSKLQPCWLLQRFYMPDSLCFIFLRCFPQFFFFLQPILWIQSANDAEEQKGLWRHADGKICSAGQQQSLTLPNPLFFFPKQKAHEINIVLPFHTIFVPLSASFVPFCLFKRLLTILVAVSGLCWVPIFTNPPPVCFLSFNI